MRASLLFLAVVCGGLAGGCGGAASHAGGTEVVASFYPLAWAAERIAGEGTEVVNLTPAGAEPHDLELSARDVERIRAARLVVYVGAGFQPAVEDAVSSRDLPPLDVLGTSGGDPHVWLDPVRFAAIVRSLGAALGRPGAVKSLAAEVLSLDSEYRSGLASCERRTIVTSHAAFGRLAGRYGLEQLAIAGQAPESEPTPRELEGIVSDVRASGATTVFREPLASSRLAETVARETGARVAVLDPLEGPSRSQLEKGEDYLSLMRANLVALREALGCR